MAGVCNRDSLVHASGGRRPGSVDDSFRICEDRAMNWRRWSKLLFFLLLATVLGLALAPAPWEGPLQSDTSRHYLAFLVLPLVARRAWPRLPLWQLWLGFAVLGGAIELMQLEMALGRQAEWRDWFNDLGAITLALIVDYAASLVAARLAAAAAAANPPC